MIVSIDIGTSYSSICRLDPNGRAQAVDISTGASMFGSKYSLPTAVFVEEDGRLLVGQAAMNRRKSNPQNFRMEFKRNLGEDIPILLGGRSFRPEDLYTRLFRHMKECAEKEGGEPVEMAYLTYPASYGEGRRNRLRAAAKAAGLFEVELVDEPTAAAMCYCAEGYIEEGQTLLVYDFGGGTFDVSVLRYEGGAFRLLSEPGGLERCGGIDMDRLIFQDMLSHVDADTLESLKERQRNYVRFVNQLGELAVKAKHHLSAAQVFEEEIEIGFDMIPYRLTVEQFNGMIAPLVGDTIQACRHTLEEAGVGVSELSAVLMMGGTSRVPLVQGMAQGISGTARLLYSVNLELAVAQGALSYRNGSGQRTGSDNRNGSHHGNNNIVRSAEEWLHMGEDAARREEWTDAVSCYQKAAEQGNAEATGRLENSDKECATARKNSGISNKEDVFLKSSSARSYIGKSIFANYFRGMEAVGGKIYFDDKGFTFKSHSFNIQNGDTRIEYNEIQQIQKANTLGIVPNSIYVFTKDGTRHQFVINNRSNVIKFLESVIGSM